MTRQMTQIDTARTRAEAARRNGQAQVMRDLIKALVARIGRTPASATPKAGADARPGALAGRAN